MTFRQQELGLNNDVRQPDACQVGEKAERGGAEPAHSANNVHDLLKVHLGLKAVVLQSMREGKEEDNLIVTGLKYAILNSQINIMDPDECESK